MPSVQIHCSSNGWKGIPFLLTHLPLVSHQCHTNDRLTKYKTYGFHLLESFPFRDRLPLKEDLPRVAEPYASQLFYYWEIDRMKALSVGKSWTYCEIRPDMLLVLCPTITHIAWHRDLPSIFPSLRKCTGRGAQFLFQETICHERFIPTTLHKILSLDSVSSPLCILTRPDMAVCPTLPIYLFRPLGL